MPICGKHARGSRPRRARPPWRPTLDVDESVAAAVLARVESPRDRLALACVSRVWRRASATAGAWGAWGTCDLVLDGELGEKVTDERFERLMLYCGDVKHLEVRDAPEGFEGVYLSGLNGPARSLAAKFASLTTVVLTGCESVDGAHIVDLMMAIGMTSRPKKDRLRRLHLAGCQVDDDEVATLSECVRLGRLENYAACRKEPHEEQDDECLGGLGGCDATMCGACAEASKREFFMCHDCERCSCTMCEPELRLAVCRFCGLACCAECDPGMRPIVDTLVDGLRVRPFCRERARKSDACCPTCEVTEFICA